MAAVAGAGTTIVRVRLRGGGGDPLAAQLRAAQVLAHAADLADEVPPAAVLCVRRLFDPLPGRVALARRTAPPGWTHAVRERVRDLARRAARPAREIVTDDPEAVIFADRAELLACLARDCCLGALDGWWWRPLIGNGTGLDAVLRAWLDQPTHVAAALDRAASMQVAAAFVSRLSPADTRALFEVVVASHALTRLRAVDISRTASSTASSPERESRSVEPPGTAPAASTSSAPAPWRTWAFEATDSMLRRDQQLVLGVALTVRRAPVDARSAAFATAVATWWAAPAVANGPGIPAASSGPIAEPEVDTSIPDAVFSDAAAVPALASPAMGRAPVEPSVSVDPRAATPTTAAPATRPQAAPAAGPAPGVRPEEAAAGGVSIATRYAGVFYLLNVALAMELYGDFTTPATRGLDLSIWDFLALVGRALLPRDGIERDPLWPLLAMLAGRGRASALLPGDLKTAGDVCGAEEEPGVGFEAPADWRVPAGWLLGFPERGDWRWAVTSDRLRVRHPAGFLVVDVRRGPMRADAQLDEELAPYGIRARFAARSMTLRPTADPLDRWLGWIVPYVRARLALSLGTSRLDGVGRAVCRAAGRVLVTSARVDVVLPLAGQPIAVRLAGLDRDPGWIPAADRHVAFHFE